MPKKIFKIAVTDYCNMNCIYCSQHKALPRDKAVDKVFSDEEILKLVKIACKAGIDTIHLTGGEPMMRPGILELMERIRDFPRVEHLILSTNGTLATEAKMERICQYVDEIHVSLDAMQAFDLADITGLSQCMNEILGCLWSASSKGIRTRVNCMLIDGIQKHVPLLGDLGKNMDFDICFKELEGDSKGVPLLPANEVKALLTKRYGKLQQVACEDPRAEMYTAQPLKARLGIIHAYVERKDMVFLDARGVLYCGDRMRRMIDLGMKLEHGAGYEDFAQYFGD